MGPFNVKDFFCSFTPCILYVVLKNKLTFITNIPSPYNIDMFESLAIRIDLSVYFYTNIESERQWSLDIDSPNYKTTVFKKDLLYNLFQKINRNLYLNIQVFEVSFSRSDYFILGGNYFSPNTLILLLILKLRGQKIFWFGEKLFPSRSRTQHFIKRVLISPVNWCTRAIFAVGEEARQSYRSYGYKNPILNTPYAINQKRFYDFKQKENKTNGKFIFLSSGSLIHRKGYDLAIKAFNLLPEYLKSRTEYWIMGDGPLLSDLRSLVKPEFSVKFLGFVEPKDIATYYRVASCFLLTSRYDGWGVVVNEAISAGLPVIVTNTCGAAEYVDADGGFVVNCDVNEISNRIEYVLLHPETTEKFSQYNLDKASMISSDKIAEMMLNKIRKF